MSMDLSTLFTIRVTGVLIENNSLLIVKQKLSDKRNWSLPGGKLERGESLEEGIIREMKEETGLDVKVKRMLYVCDVASSGYKLLHITFLLSKIGGELTLPTNEFDDNPIDDVKFVPIADLSEFGFSKEFIDLIYLDFPSQGNYMGDKREIGLG